MGAAEKGVMALLGLVVLFIVVRPLVRRIVRWREPRPALAGAAARRVARHRFLRYGQFVGPSRQHHPTAAAPTSRSRRRRIGRHLQSTSAMIDVAKVQGQVHAQSVQKVA